MGEDREALLRTGVQDDASLVSPGPRATYYIDDEPPSDLGWVNQGWTTLGAAERVERGLTDATTSLLVLAILAAVVCAAGLQSLSISAREREVTILRVVGWTRGQVAGLLVAEAILGGVAVVAFSALGWLVGGHGTAGLVAGALIGCVYLMAALGASMAALAAADRFGAAETGLGARRLRMSHPPSFEVQGATTLGLRMLSARPGRTMTIVGAIGVTSAALSIGIGQLAALATSVGPTRLATVLAEGTRPFEWVLIGSIALTGAVFVVTASRAEARTRSSDVLALVSAGWTRSDLRHATMAWSAGMATMSAVLTTMLVVWAQVTRSEVSLALMMGTGAVGCIMLALVGGLILGRPQASEGS